MSNPNPLSIPGGWKKDTPRETPTAEKSDPVESIPRSATGLVSESGEIIDHEGKVIGKLTESEDARSLVGNTVTATGDVVNEAGNILGRASLDGKEQEYTTQDKGTAQKEVPEDAKAEAEKTGGGASGFLSSASSVFKQGLGFTSRSKKSDSEAGQEDTPKAQEAQDDVQTQGGESLGDVASQAPTAPSEAPEAPSEAQDEIQTQAGESQKDLGSQAPDAPSEVPDELRTDAGETEKGDLGDAPVQLEDHEKEDDLKTTTDKTDLNPDETKELTEQPPIPEGEEQAEQAKDTIEGEAADKDTVEGEAADKEDEAEQAKDAVAGEVPAEGEEGEEQAKDAVAGEIPAEGEEGEEKKDEEGEEEDESEQLDYTILKDAKVNKIGNLVNSDGNVVGQVIEGIVKQLQGRRSDEEGNIWNESGKKVGKAQPLSQADREGQKEFAPFENFPDAVVEADGKVVSDGRQVGVVTEGDPKRLKGSKVDEDGDILDRNGNVVGKAEAWDEPEPIPEEVVDRSVLAGKRVNKAGNVVDSAGTIFGRVVEGNVSAIIGRMCDKEGNIRSESGDIVGKAEVVPEGEREGSKEGPFAELSGLTVTKDGKVVTPSNDVVGRLIKGDPKVLYGRSVDEDGDVVDKNGNVLGKAERWEEPEEEKKKGPLAGRRVNREGNVVDEDGNIIAKLVSGDVLSCSGKEIDDDGDVINAKGHTVGHVALLEDIPAEPEPEETEEEKKARVEAEKAQEEAERDRKLAGQLGGCIEQSLDKIRPLCNLITSKIDAAEKTPKEELDEEQLVREVRPLIEEGGKILSETNGIIRGLDPDGRIQRQSKQRAGTKEASPEEHHLAEQLKELTGTVSQTIDNAKRKIEGMPHAKKELNPLWGLLMEPLGQIIAAVGLLLNGVLGLVGKLLSGLGLGGILDNLLGGLGLNKVLGSLGLGSAYDALVGKDKKKK